MRYKLPFLYNTEGRRAFVEKLCIRAARKAGHENGNILYRLAEIMEYEFQTRYRKQMEQMIAANLVRLDAKRKMENRVKESRKTRIPVFSPLSQKDEDDRTMRNEFDTESLIRNLPDYKY